MRSSTTILGGLTVATLFACEDPRASGDDLSLPPPGIAPEAGRATVDDPIVPLPTHVELDKRRVALGGKLFRDPILSRNRDQSCVACHPFERAGADGVAKSHLPGQEEMAVNTPTVFNAGFNYKLHWNGKWDSLEAQLETPITSPRAMNTTFEVVVERLAESEEYRLAFAAIYPDGVTEKNFRDVMATYVRSLVTPRSRFDRFLSGELDAIDDRERRGYALFKSHGCISCHQGVNVGGNMMQRFGALKDYFAGRRVSESDLGLFLVTKREEDKHVFRVASLRNVALTAPYFHDGSVNSLEEAVRIMSEYQLGRSLTDEQVGLIVAFLGTLTGETDEVEP